MRAALAALLLTTACAGWKPRMQYLAVHDDHTEKGLVRRDLGDALKIEATYLSSTMRQAILAERARLLGASETDPGPFERRLTEDGELYHEVVFSAESNLFDIEEDPVFGLSDKGWRIRLLADGVEQPLVTVFQVQEPTTLQAAIYAQFNVFNTLWIARFDKKTPLPAKLVLAVGSGFGNREIAWEMDQLK